MNAQFFAQHFTAAITNQDGTVTPAKPAIYTAYPADAAALAVYNEGINLHFGTVQKTTFTMYRTKSGKLNFKDCGAFNTPDFQKLVNGTLKKKDSTDGVEVAVKACTEIATASNGIEVLTFKDFEFRICKTAFIRKSKAGGDVTFKVGDIILEIDRTNAYAVQVNAAFQEIEDLKLTEELDRINKRNLVEAARSGKLTTQETIAIFNAQSNRINAMGGGTRSKG
jgi:hypothetical protein